MNAEGSVTLSAGILKEVVAEIERRIGHWTLIEGGEQSAMPNLMYASDAYNAEVPGDLRLRGVSPLQAVAFAAAAAGCTLEPIFAPAEEAGLAGKPQHIIGYRIVRESAQTRSSSLTQKQYAEILPEDTKIRSQIMAADAKLQSLSEKYGSNHPTVLEHRKLLQLLKAQAKTYPRGVPAKIPSIVRGRLLDKDGKPLGKKPLASLGTSGCRVGGD